MAMRALLLAVLAISVLGCTDDSVSNDTSFRRLIDGYSSYDQCIAAQPFEVCYQTLTLCPSGMALLDLENHLEDGRYKLEDDTAVVTFRTRTVTFDLAAATSAQLPGQHPWERVEPTFTGCD